MIDQQQLIVIVGWARTGQVTRAEVIYITYVASACKWQFGLAGCNIVILFGEIKWRKRKIRHKLDLVLGTAHASKNCQSGCPLVSKAEIL
jgi:hypothetical protein